MEFRILGPLTILRDGEPVPLGHRREQVVLAALLLDANRLVPLVRLVEAVWDDPPRSATKAVRNAISGLRACLAAAGDADGAGLLETQPAGYTLRVADGELDAQVFGHRVAQAGRLAAAGDRAAAVRELRGALALWRGPALSGIEGRTVEAAATGLNERRLAVLEDCLALELALGRDRELIDELSALVAEHPLRERLRGQLMTALYRGGRRTEALLTYRAGRAIMVRELGLEPGPELRKLERDILCDHPALAEPAARRRRAVRPPAQLPADVTTFVGRTAQLQELDGMVAEPDGQPPKPLIISAIAGTPGVGKTALAVHWAHRIRHRFPDGQLHVDLRGHSNGPPKRALEALTTFLLALEVPPDQIPVDVEPAAALYRTLLASRRVLVLLDNAVSADQVRPLLPGNPGCVVLITSRNRLTGLVAREGARLVTLDVLTAEEAEQLLTRTLGEQRTRAEPAAAAELVEACARLPLALRIAAAHLVGQPDRTLASYVAALRAGNRLAALQIEGDDQVAVRAAFDQSYATLAPDAQRMLRRLGLLPGRDVTAESAAALAGVAAAAADRLLDVLAAAHLVRRGGDGRSTFHDLLRSYAAERTHAEDTEAERRAAVQRLYDWYLDMVGQAARLLYPQMIRLTDAALPLTDPAPDAALPLTDPALPLPAPDVALPPTDSVPAPSAPDAALPLTDLAELPSAPAAAQPTAPAPAAFTTHSAALAWLDAERPNLVAATLHAAEHGPRPSAVLLADAARGYFHLRRGHGADWLAVAGAALAVATTEDDPRAQAAAQLSLADANQRRSRYPTAIEHYRQALALTEQTGWLDGRGVVLGNLGFVYWQTGQLTEAVEQISAALDISRNTGRRVGIAVNLDNLGAVNRELGRLAEARDTHQAALAMHREIASRLGEAIALGNLAEAHHALGELDQAAETAGAALAIHRQVGDRGNETEVLRVLAAVQRDKGDLGKAVEYGRAAVNLAQETGDRRLEASALNTLASIEQRLARHADAATRHRRAVDLAHEINAVYYEAEALAELAAAHDHLGDTEDALAAVTRALDLARSAGFRLVQGQALIVLASIRAGGGDFGQARVLAGEALDLLRDCGHRAGAARAHRLLTAGVSDDFRS